MKKRDKSPQNRSGSRNWYIHTYKHVVLYIYLFCYWERIPLWRSLLIDLHPVFQTQLQLKYQYTYTAKFQKFKLP